MQDKSRKYVRRPVNVELVVRDANDLLGGEILFDAVDLSEGGAFLRSDFLMEEGERLEIRFTLPRTETSVAKTIHAQARVAWVTPRTDLKGEAGMGVEFVRLSEEEKAAIDAFVQSYNASQSSPQTP